MGKIFFYGFHAKLFSYIFHENIYLYITHKNKQNIPLWNYLGDKTSSNDTTLTIPKSPEITTASSFSPEMTLSRLHDYNNLAAYFSSHAAAAAMASSANVASQQASPSSMSGFLQQNSYLHKTHAPIPSPFFLPSGTYTLLYKTLELVSV